MLDVIRLSVPTFRYFPLSRWGSQANLEAVWRVYWFYTLWLKRLHVTMATGLYREVWLKCTLFRVPGTRQHRRGVDLARNYGYFPHESFTGLPGWKRDRDALYKQRVITDTAISLSLVLGFHETWIFACYLFAFTLRPSHREDRSDVITRLICKRK